MTRTQRTKLIDIVAKLEKQVEQGRSAKDVEHIELAIAYVLDNQDKPLEDILIHFEGQINRDTVSESYKAVHDLIAAI